MMKVVHVNPESDKPFCVCGCANNEAGQRIAYEMEEWLLPHYHLIQVWHDGSQFEYPALAFMQDLCKKTGKPCLYVHTRGAYNRWKTTKPTHRMWQHEFGELAELYARIVHTPEPVAACPFTGEGKETFYNGFMANAAAMAAIPDIQPNTDRMVFEYIFRGSPVKVYGTIFNDVGYDTLGKARNYLYANYI